MGYHKSRSIVHLLIAAVGITSPAHGQITHWHKGPGAVRTRPPLDNLEDRVTEANDAFSAVHENVISVRVDASMHMKTCPQEAKRCIVVCDRLEKLIKSIRRELAKGHAEDESLSAFNDTSQEFLIASRDLYEAIANPPRPYRLPGWKIGSGSRSQ